MLLMLGIVDRLLRIIEAGQAATVLWRSATFARNAHRVNTYRFRWQAFFYRDSMVPAITEVVSVYSLYSRPAQPAESSCGSFAGSARFTRGFHRIGCSESLPSNTELMHVAVLPTNGQLQDVMQLPQRHVGGNQQPPDCWIRAERVTLIW